MTRGPRSINFAELLRRAESMAASLYALFEGRPGFLVHSKGGVWKTKQMALLREEELGRPDKVRERILEGQMQYEPLRFKMSVLIVPPTDQGRKDAKALVRHNRHWRYTQDIVPRPEMWERLIKARSLADVRNIASRLRPDHPMLASMLHSYAGDFLRAKRLHNYPMSNRPSSEYKRIEFYARVFAGLSLGIAPATTTRRLPQGFVLRYSVYNWPWTI
jgi:hypothetical protein